ncbi:hypothetical protein ACQ4PT_020943 [Festuca glaucescens]
MVVVAWSDGADTSDLRNLAGSSLDSLKRHLDALHGDHVRDLEASHSRICKRTKVISDHMEAEVVRLTELETTRLK